MDNNSNNQLSDDLYKKYDEIFKNILICLIEDTQDNDVTMKLEKILIDFDKIIDEECLNRIKNTHILNAQYIANFKKINTQEIPSKENKYVKYDDLINKIQNNLKEININK